MRSHLLLATLTAMSLLTAACGKKTAEAEPAAAAPVAKAALDGNDPCRLVSAAEAEAVLGSTLATPPYRSRGGIGDSAGSPLADSDVCWFEAANRKNLSVSLTRRNGGAVLSGIAKTVAIVEDKTKAKFQDGSELTGEWDEAKVLNCCDFMALRGDSLVEIDTGGSEATPQQIASLADAALKRLEAPLPYDSSLGFAAAEALYAKRPNSGDACSLLSKADVEAAMGAPVKGEPQVSGNECTWTYTGKGGGASLKSKIPKGTMSDEELKMLSGFMNGLGASEAIGETAGGGRSESFVLAVTWRNGYRHYRVDNQMLGSMGAGLGFEADGAAGKAKLGSSKTLQGPWEMAQTSAIQFNSVKNDVQIAVRPGSLTAEQYKALMTRAYANALK